MVRARKAKTKFTPQPEPTLEQRFAECAPEFRAKVEKIAELGGKTVMDVYALWREYAETCRWSDQSAILREFVRWYKDRLGTDPGALEAAGAV